MTRRPLTIALAFHLRAKSTTSSREDVDLDVVELRERVAEEGDAFVEREHRLLVVRVADDADDDAVEDARRAADHVDVPVRDGVVRAGADRGHHSCSKTVTRVEPYLRVVRTARPGSSGSILAADSSTSRPSSESDAREVARELVVVGHGVRRVGEHEIVLPACRNLLRQSDGRA